MSQDAQRVSYGNGREALMRATVRVVAAKGLRGLTFRAVAEEAGVNNTLIAHHFKNRDGLLAATLEWSTDQSLAAANLGDYESDQRALFEGIVRNVLSQPDLEVFQYEMILEATRREELRPLIRQLYQRYLAALLPGMARPGLEPNEALSRAMFATFDGLVLQFFSHAITAEQFTEALRAMDDAIHTGVARLN